MIRFLKIDKGNYIMRKVVSVRLREDIVRDIDIYTKKLGLNSRTAFIKEALDFYIKRKAKENL